MTEWRGTLAGEALGDRLTLLAGVLAELGVTRVVLEVPNERAAHLAARESDLPGLLDAALVRAGRVSLTASERALRLEVTTHSLTWRTTDAEAAALLRRPTLFG